MKLPMYQTEWLGLDLNQFPAAAEARDKPAGPEFYSQFYSALAAGQGNIEPGYLASRKSFGALIEKDFLEPLQARLRRPLRVLSLAVGIGAIEEVWIEHGYDVVLQECQPSSLREMLLRHPQTRTLIGDVRDLDVDEKFDAIAMFAMDCALPQEDVRALFTKASQWLSRDGEVLFYSPTNLSWRQLAAEWVKTLRGDRRRRPHVFWGWWRTVGEYCRLAANGGLRDTGVFRFSASGLRRRKAWLEHLPTFRELLIVIRFTHRQP